MSTAAPAPLPHESTEGFTRALATVAGVEGWLSDDQAQRLWERARELEPGASMVEIGSFRGRSAIVLALAAPAGSVLHAIDPHAGGDRGPREIADNPVAGASDIAAFRANLESAGVSDRVRHVRLPSTQALAVVTGPIDLLYIDGAHRYAPARMDIKRWGARVKPGGVMLIHDGFSSVGVTLAVLRLLAFGRQFVYEGRSRSLLQYRRSELSDRQRVTNASRQLAQLGWFARNVTIKLAIVTRARWLLRALGERSAEWPY